jgi:hypothetical protein
MVASATAAAVHVFQCNADLSDVCSRPILLALLPGAEAKRLEEETTAETTARCLGILKNMFGADQVRLNSHLCGISTFNAITAAASVTGSSISVLHLYVMALLPLTAIDSVNGDYIWHYCY